MTKSYDVSRAAARALADIDATLRRAEDLHWTDPEFLAWERGQVGGASIAELPHYDTGEVLQRWRHYPADRYGVYSVQPIAALTRPPGSSGMARMRVAAGDYPPPERTVHGPLLLGPEPEVVRVRCEDCDGEGDQLDTAGPCEACGGMGLVRIAPDRAAAEP